MGITKIVGREYIDGYLVDSSKSQHLATQVKLRVVSLPRQLQLPVQAAEDLLMSIFIRCMEG